MLQSPSRTVGSHHPGVISDLLDSMLDIPHVTLCIRLNPAVAPPLHCFLPGTRLPSQLQSAAALFGRYLYGFVNSDTCVLSRFLRLRES